MPIGTPVSLGGLENTTSFTTSADCPAGSLIVVVVADWGNTNTDFSTGTVSDTASNSYSFIAQSTPTSGLTGTSIFACINSANDLPSGGTISCSLSRGEQIHAAYVTGANGGVDIHNSTINTSATTSTSVNVPTLSQATEIVFGATNNNNNMLGVTETNGYTQLQNTSQRKWIDFAYLTAASTTPAAYAPGSFTSGGNSAVIVSFKATSSGGTSYSLSLSGVSYSLTGTADTFGVGMPLSSSSYSYLGTAAGFGIGLPTGATSYSVAGTPSFFGIGMPLSSSGYTHAGTQLSFNTKISLIPGTSSYLFTGGNPSLTYTQSGVTTEVAHYLPWLTPIGRLRSF